MNDHEIELFYKIDLSMMLKVIVMYYLFEVDLLEEMEEMVVVLIQQSRIFKIECMKGFFVLR
jgi:hypothetical protein